MTKDQIQEFTLRITQANHTNLAIILCDMVAIYIKDALSSFEIEKTTDRYGNVVVYDYESLYHKNMEAAKKVHLELMSTVNQKDDAGSCLWRILVLINGSLINSKIKKKPIELNEALTILGNVRRIFERLSSIDYEPPVMQNTHQVYAGLTYGKGVLNESINKDNDNNRGFFV